MAEELVILDGNTFFISDAVGDVAPGVDANGFFYADMRHLSTWQLLVDGKPVRLLSSRIVDYYSGRIFATLGSARIMEHPVISIQRDRFVSDGVHEDLVLENHSHKPQRITVELRFYADFADLFEVKTLEAKKGSLTVEPSERRATLHYERNGFARTTILSFSAPCSLTADTATFEIELGPRARWQTCIDITCIVDGIERRPSVRCGSFGKPRPKMPLTLEQWLVEAPALETDSDVLDHTYRQSLLDLAALRFRPSQSVTWSLPAAGLPWFMALFGRDALITSYQALPFEPHLAVTTLEALAELQAREFDDFRDAEPGKILHELRLGELAQLGDEPHTPYYGTHDATPLFLILLDEYERWSGDVELVRLLEPAARAALTWIERYGDSDGDGYLEYRTRSGKGLINQGWKDSWNSTLFANGELAEPPIALCELQGYAYDARMRTARLARVAWEDGSLATRLEADAAELRHRFNLDYWNEDRGHFVLALDGQKRQVDSLTSNVGHLLWSGIVDEVKAAVTAQRLFAPDMFSGWGVRTMSAGDVGYSPIEYHNGSVWPHDTAIIAEGLRRYGFREQASRLAQVIIEAAGYFDHRLPEVFSGFSRKETGFPVQYPTACRPQAWAAGAALLTIRTMLGLDPMDGRLRADPHLPEKIGRLQLSGMQFRGQRIDVSLG